MQTGTIYGLVLVCFFQVSSLHGSMVYGLNLYRHEFIDRGVRGTLRGAKVSEGMEDVYAPQGLVTQMWAGFKHRVPPAEHLQMLVSPPCLEPQGQAARRLPDGALEEAATAAGKGLWVCWQNVRGPWIWMGKYIFIFITPFNYRCRQQKQ